MKAINAEHLRCAVFSLATLWLEVDVFDDKYPFVIGTDFDGGSIDVDEPSFELTRTMAGQLYYALNGGEVTRLENQYTSAPSVTVRRSGETLRLIAYEGTAGMIDLDLTVKDQTILREILEVLL